MTKHDLICTFMSIFFAIALALGVWGTYCQLKQERIENAQQKSESQQEYSIPKHLGTQNCR